MNFFKDLFPFPTYSYLTLSQGNYDNNLLKEESNLTLNFSRKRLHEFSIGRYCARMALSKLGVDEFPLLIAKSGSPIWPQKIVGSIAHTQFCTAAVVAHASFAKSIGMDIEEISNFPMEIKDDILRRDEVNDIQLYCLCPDEVQLALIFSIKEAVYKAYNPVYHRFLEFKDVKVSVSYSNSSYLAYVDKLPNEVGNNQDVLVIEGCFSIDSARIYTSAWIKVERHDN